MADLFLKSDDTVGLSLGVFNIFGASGRETVVAEGTASIVADANIEQIDLLGDSSGYRFSADGIKVSAINSDGITVATINAASSATVRFADGAATLAIDTSLGAVTLGGAAIPSFASSITPRLDPNNVSLAGSSDNDGSSKTVSVDGSDAYDASNGAYIFDVTNGNFEVTIDGFGSDDVIEFEAGNNAATVSEQQFGNDGRFTISSTNSSDSTEVVVSITGYGDDSGIFTSGDLVEAGIVDQANETSSSAIFGTVSDDTNLTGTIGNDVINPLTGNDKIFSFSGSDTVLLGSGSKYIDFGVDNSADTLVVDLNAVDTQSTIVNFSYNNEDTIQFMGSLYDGFDRTMLSTSEEVDDFIQNVMAQEYIPSLSEDGIYSYHFGSEVASNLREENDLNILNSIEEALEDTASGDGGLGLLSGANQQVQNAIDGAKVLLSFADTSGNRAWCIYEENGGDLDFSGELSLILVTSMTSDSTFSGELTIPGPGDLA